MFFLKLYDNFLTEQIVTSFEFFAVPKWSSKWTLIFFSKHFLIGSYDNKKILLWTFSNFYNYITECGIDNQGMYYWQIRPNPWRQRQDHPNCETVVIAYTRHNEWNRIFVYPIHFSIIFILFWNRNSLKKIVLSFKFINKWWQF